jgi:ferritin-like protein
MKEWRDPITFHIIRHIMQEEVDHEETMEDLL